MMMRANVAAFFSCSGCSSREMSVVKSVVTPFFLRNSRVSSGRKRSPPIGERWMLGNVPRCCLMAVARRTAEQVPSGSASW